MISSSVSIIPAVRGSNVRLLRGVALVFAACALSTSLWAQTATTTPPAAAAPAATPAADNAGATDNANPAGRNRRGNQNGNGGGNFDPAAMQARMMANLRDQFEVPDDAEWNLISQHITTVFDLRRSTMGGFGGFGGMRGGNGGGGNRPNRTGATANPEVDALRTAITDKLPDAEIKARLERLREVRKENEAKLTKAQEELRAVLTVRQEAVAVMFGLLP